MPSEEYNMPEYTHIIGPRLGTEITFEEGTSLDCSFDVKQRTPCDPLYRLVLVESTVTMILELAEEEDA